MIAVTSMSSYLFCPRKLYLEKVLKLVKPKKAVLIKGAIRHETYEKINNKEKELVVSINSEELSVIFSIYKKTFSTILRNIIIKNKSNLRHVNLDLGQTFKEMWPMILIESSNRSKTISSFIKTHNLFGIDLWQKLTPKIKSEIKINSNNLRLRGIVDQIQKYDSFIIPIELKTGKAPREGIWPGHKIQLASYMLMLKEEGYNIQKGIVNYLDANSPREIIMNPFLQDEVTNLRDKTESILNSKKLPPIIDNKNKCKVCELREKCYEM